MKRILSFIICTLCVLMLVPFSALAITPIDPARASSLTLQYRHEGTPFEGLEIRTYRIARVYENGTYALTDPFSEYPVHIYDVTSQAEWRQIASTLASYAAADQIVPTCTAKTDGSGTVSFTDILPGMYLTLSVTAVNGDTTVLFENFLTVVPHPAENGEHDYDVIAYPKCESHTSEETDGETDEKKEYRVVKLWKDNGYSEERPESVAVEILRDGTWYANVELSEENNWSAHWEAEDDGSVWYAVERGVPADYTVTITEDGGTILITNCCRHEESEAPQTGDTRVVWPYMLAMCLSGGMFLILATWRKRSEM